MPARAASRSASAAGASLIAATRSGVLGEAGRAVIRSEPRRGGAAAAPDGPPSEDGATGKARRQIPGEDPSHRVGHTLAPDLELGYGELIAAVVAHDLRLIEVFGNAAAGDGDPPGEGLRRGRRAAPAGSRSSVQ
jgi:hypothetical protein